jgi:hypothetical protein
MENGTAKSRASKSEERRKNEFMDSRYHREIGFRREGVWRFPRRGAETQRRTHRDEGGEGDRRLGVGLRCYHSLVT